MTVKEATEEKEAVKEEAPVEKKGKKEKKKKKEEVSPEQLAGIGEKTLANLKEAGINSIEDILKAGLGGLTKVKGIGEKKAVKIIEEAKKLKP